MGDLCESLKAPASEGGRYKGVSLESRARTRKIISRRIREGGEEAVDFFGGVVVDQADAKHAALRFDAEAFAEI